MKKLIYSFFIFLLIVSFSISIFATNSNTQTPTTKFELVENTVCKINLNDMANFEKKLTSFDEKERSATLTLTVTNTKVSEFENKPVEIFLVIDNSNSMRVDSNKIGDVTREEIVINSANKLVDKLFTANSKAKVGVVSFSSLDSTKGETEGTINDAKLVLNLSNSKSDVEKAISSIPTNNAGPRTNIEAGLTVANQHYSSDENTNRYIVLLTDGVPNNDINGTYATYSGEVATRTKNKLKEIQASGIKIIGCMIGLDNEKIETQTNKTYKVLAEEIFGTEGAYTIDSYYNVPDTKDDIETTIINKIYQDIVVKKDNSLKNIVIKDYFPKEIIDNFNFNHITDPNIGSVTAKIDSSDNSITWTIPELKESQTATLSYKLTLKSDYDKEIINKILPTNEKVEMTAEDGSGNKYEKTSTESPKVRITQNEIVKDPTISNKIIPQAGDNNFIYILSVLFISIAAIIALKKFKD